MGTPDPRHSVRCSACTALVSAGASFCPTCGDPLAQRPPEAAPDSHRCPACPDSTMTSWRLQPTPAQPEGHAVYGCRACGGAWVDRSTLDVMIESASRQGTGDGRGPEVRRSQISLKHKIVYRPCAVCRQTMNRHNFARISGVIVDQCREHGTFFDAGELEDVLAFVRSGGMLMARRRENERLAQEERRLRSMPKSPLMAEREPFTGVPSSELAADLDLGFAFVAWAGRWIRNAFR